MFGVNTDNGKVKCSSCGWEVSAYSVDSNGDCKDCQKLECSDCYRLFNISDLSDGYCTSCEDKLRRELEMERRELENDYWCSRF